ncbi:MAG: hypothetical protein ABJ308_01245 [Halieaceae bacterium]
MKQLLLNSNDDAELEALQTDVMRFVAILGLCLAAIFSLVQRASLEQLPPTITPEVPLQSPVTAAAQPESEPPARPAPPRPATQAVVTATPKPRPTPASKPQPTPAPTPAPAPAKPSNTGFSLEFESAAALMALLQGGQLQLYAQADGNFWSADERGRFAAIAAPQSYYGMDSDTVPPALVASLAGTSAATGVAWGVALAPAIVEQMQQLMHSNEAGNIVIGGTGRVQLEP